MITSASTQNSTVQVVSSEFLSIVVFVNYRSYRSSQPCPSHWTMQYAVGSSLEFVSLSHLLYNLMFTSAKEERVDL